jgi:hypothetical protein
MKTTLLCPPLDKLFNLQGGFFNGNKIEQGDPINQIIIRDNSKSSVILMEVKSLKFSKVLLFGISAATINFIAQLIQHNFSQDNFVFEHVQCAIFTVVVGIFYAPYLYYYKHTQHMSFVIGEYFNKNLHEDNKNLFDMVSLFIGALSNRWFAIIIARHLFVIVSIILNYFLFIIHFLSIIFIS